MEIRRINNSLQRGRVTRVRFLQTPLVIPVDDKGYISEQGTREHYCSVVLVEPEQQIYLLEYGQRIQAALTGYAQRSGELENMELLLSREESGDMRITSGNKNDSDISRIKTLVDAIYRQLPKMYKKKVGYLAQDIS